MAARSPLPLVLLAILFLSGPPAAAQQRSSPPPRPDTVEAAGPCPPSADCPTLTLDAFLERVLRTSPQARSLRLADDQAAAELLDAQGRLAPRLVSGYEYKTQADKDKLNVLRSGLRYPLNLPLSPTLKLDYRRGLGSSIDPSVATSRPGETRVGVSFSPLQGLVANKRQAALDKARLAPRRARAQQAKERNALLRDATHAFWAWVKARRTLGVARDLLRLAQRRQALVTRRARAGEAPAIDSVEAAQIVARRQGTLADAVRTARQKRIALTTFLGTGDASLSRLRYAPPALPSPQAPDTIRVAPAVDTALARRPVLRALDVKQRRARVAQDLARGQRWPDLKLEAQAVSYDEGPLNMTDLKVGFAIEQPLFARSSRSDATTARLKTRQLDFERERTEQAVRADVRKAVVARRQAQQRVQTARRSVRLSRRLQRAEQRRFEEGGGTLFRLNQREQALAEARKARVGARIDVLRARTAYQWATGTIGDAHGRALR